MHYTPGKEGVTMYKLPEPKQQVQDDVWLYVAGFVIAAILTSWGWL